MAELESAEEFACKRIPYIRQCADDNIDLLESVFARDLERRDAAVALAAKRALLEEIRSAANAFLVGKGLTVSPCEAIAGAVQDAALKYTAAEPAVEKELNR